MKINNKQITQMLQRQGRVFTFLGENVASRGIPNRKNMAGAIRQQIKKMQLIVDSIEGDR